MTKVEVLGGVRSSDTRMLLLNQTPPLYQVHWRVRQLIHRISSRRAIAVANILLARHSAREIRMGSGQVSGPTFVSRSWLNCSLTLY